jgi:hypothetical protein
VHDELGAAPERVVRDGVEVPDDDVGLHPRLAKRVGAAVDRDDDGMEIPDVRADHPQVRLVAGTAGDHEDVAVAEARAERGQLETGREALCLVAQVEQGVLGERLERL